jgi:hypothetical protein
VVSPSVSPDELDELSVSPVDPELELESPVSVSVSVSVSEGPLDPVSSVSPPLDPLSVPDVGSDVLDGLVVGDVVVADPLDEGSPSDAVGLSVPPLVVPLPSCGTPSSLHARPTEQEIATTHARQDNVMHRG